MYQWVIECTICKKLILESGPWTAYERQRENGTLIRGDLCKECEEKELKEGKEKVRTK